MLCIMGLHSKLRQVAMLGLCTATATRGEVFWCFIVMVQKGNLDIKKLL